MKNFKEKVKKYSGLNENNDELEKLKERAIRLEKNNGWEHFIIKEQGKPPYIKSQFGIEPEEKKNIIFSSRTLDKNKKKSVSKSSINEDKGSKIAVNNLVEKYEKQLRSLIKDMEKDEANIVNQIRSAGDDDWGKLNQFRKVKSHIEDSFVKLRKILLIE